MADKHPKLNNQPLKLVLVELRFAPNPQMVEYIPRLQQSLRKLYPLPAEIRNEQTIQISQGGITVTTVDKWGFVSANRKSAVEVTSDRLIYYTADYPRFDGFAANFRAVLELFSGIVEPVVTRRIGLRYSDLVTLSDSETMSDLVNSHFVYPEFSRSLGTPRHQRNELFLETEMGGLLIRSLYGVHNLMFMPDIQALPILIDIVAGSSERMVLDFDHFWEAKGETPNYDTDDVMDKLGRLHDTSIEAFFNISSAYATGTKWL